MRDSIVWANLHLRRAGGRDGAEGRREALVWAGTIALLLATAATVHDGANRVAVFRAVVALAAIGEAAAFVGNALRPRQFAERNRRPWDPAYHGVMQDFAFYNLAFGLMLAGAAVDPTRATMAVAIVGASYTIHALAHLGRWRGWYFGGGAPLATRPQTLELRDGLQLLAAVVGMAWFRPH